MPDFLAVGDGDAFPGVAVAVLLDEISGEADGFAGGSRPLEHQPFDLLDHEHAFVIDKLLASTDGRLADGQPLLVQAGIGRVQELVGFRHLGDLARLEDALEVGRSLGVHLARVDLVHGLVRPLLMGHDVQPGPIGAVTCVAGDDRTVHGRQPADLDGRASVPIGGPGFRGGPLGGGQGNDGCEKERKDDQREEGVFSEGRYHPVTPLGQIRRLLKNRCASVNPFLGDEERLRLIP